MDYLAMSTDEKIREIEWLTNIEFEKLILSGRFDETMRIRNEQKTKGLLEFFKRMKDQGHWIESDDTDYDVPILCSKA